MMSDNPLATVDRMFEAFQDQDLDRLLETVHPDSRWTYIGANPQPVKATLVGKDGVRKFFGNILNEWTQQYVVRSGLITEMAEYNIHVPTTS